MENVMGQTGTAVEDISSDRMSAADTVGSACRTDGNYTDGSQRIALKTAQMFGTSAGYLRTHDAQEIMSDAENMARQNPVPSLIGAVALGFLLGAFLRRS